MTYQYTIKELATSCQVSTQSIYNLKDKNKEFFKQNSKRNQRTIYYNQAVLDFLLEYYHLDNGTSNAETLIEKKLGGGHPSSDEENSSFSTSFKDELTESRIKEYEDQIAALKAEVESLKTDLVAKEAERQELIKQNGILILTLSQEKQEKLLLLPAPKKTFSEKIKTFLKNHSHQG